MDDSPAATATAGRPRRYTIVGVGGVGGWYGSRLALAGHPVQWVARSDADHLRRHGLVVEHAGGTDHLTDLAVYTDADAEAVPAADVVLVATKTTESVAAVAARLATGGAVLGAMQNGLRPEATLATAAPGATVLGLMCFVCTAKAGPGHVVHYDYGPVTVGQHTRDGAAAGVTDAVAAVVDDLRAAGVTASPVADLAAGRWRKLMWNIPFNGLTVALDTTTDALLRDPGTRRLVEDLMAEVEAAATADGHAPPADAVARFLVDTEAMTPYATSMKVDFDAGRPLELDAIFDDPVAVGRSVGVAMPRTEALAAQLHFLDRRNRGA